MELTKRDSFFNGLVTRDLLEELDSIYKKNRSTYEFIYSKEENKLKLFIHCSLDFYSIVDGKLIKEYRYMNRGYTCGPNVFFRDEAYHILGGQGFWLHHVDLMKFDSLLGSWELIQAKNQPLDYFPRGSFHNKKGITSIFGEYNNLRIPRKEKEPHGYFLDWEQKTWYPIRFETKEINLSEIVNANTSYLYETEDYALLVSNSDIPSIGWKLWVLIEKETGKLFLLEGVNNFYIADSFYHEIIGNSIYYNSSNVLNPIEGKEEVLDLEEIRKKSKEIGYINYLKESPSKTDLLPLYLFILLSLLLLGIGIWIFMKRRTTEEPSTSHQELQESPVQDEAFEELLQRLLPHHGEKLTTESFDTILGIDQITNFDSKRIKRSRLIKAVNAYYTEKKGEPLITRIKNPEDKRYIYYKLKP